MNSLSGVVTKVTWPAIFLLVLTVLVYWPVGRCEFAGFDDELYITGNLQVQSGLNWSSFLWALTATNAANWHPVTWVSHLLDVELFGLNPSGHHVTNLLIHCLNVLLLFLVLREATGDLLKSVLVAGLFSVHPLNVESVAWVAERKTVLSMLFLLMALWMYVKYTRRGTPWLYVSVIAFFSLSLMSKPMGVTFPFLLLLLDFWPLRRITSKQDPQGQFTDEKRPVASAASAKMSEKRKTGRRQQASKFEVTHAASMVQTGTTRGSNWGIRQLVILEKIPLFILSIASSLVTLKVQRMGGAVESMQAFSISSRTANAIVSYARYVMKMIWPVDLAVFYPHPGRVQPLPLVVLATSILLLISFVALLYFKRFPFIFVGWFWYLGTLVPMIGLVQVGEQAMADRYAYLPMIGLFILIAWALAKLSNSITLVRTQLPWLGLVVIIVLSITTRWNLQFWKNGAELFARAAHVTDNNFVAYNGLGKAMADKGEYDQAISNFQKALALKPNYGLARRNLAAAEHNRGADLARRGRNDEALGSYTRALEIQPDRSEYHYDMGLALSALGRIDEAVSQFKEALVLNPAFAQAYRELGSMLYRQGNADGAIANYLKSAEIRADYQTFYNLGAVLANQGKIEQAKYYFHEALRLKPGDAEIRKTLATLGEDSKTIR